MEKLGFGNMCMHDLYVHNSAFGGVVGWANVLVYAGASSLLYDGY
jgi:hypothetical protein